MVTIDAMGNSASQGLGKGNGARGVILTSWKSGLKMKFKKEQKKGEKERAKQRKKRENRKGREKRRSKKLEMKKKKRIEN